MNRATRLPPNYRRERVFWDEGRHILEGPCHTTGKFMGVSFEAWLDSDGHKPCTWSCAVKIEDIYMRTFGVGGSIRAARKAIRPLVKEAVWLFKTERGLEKDRPYSLNAESHTDE